MHVHFIKLRLFQSLNIFLKAFLFGTRLWLELLLGPLIFASFLLLYYAKSLEVLRFCWNLHILVNIEILLLKSWLNKLRRKNWRKVSFIRTCWIASLEIFPNRAQISIVDMHHRNKVLSLMIICFVNRENFLLTLRSIIFHLLVQLSNILFVF